MVAAQGAEVDHGARGALVGRSDTQVLWENATEILITTAMELDRHDANAYRLGRLVITSVTLQDVGLVGCVGVACVCMYTSVRTPSTQQLKEYPCGPQACAF